MFQFKRPNPAMVIVAVLAILALGGGTATAARLITGKQIKNNSITGKDIKNRSIKLSDLGFYNGDGTGATFVVEKEATLAPGATTTDTVGLGNFKAECPADTTVVGTGFAGPVAGPVGFVMKFGNFVGAWMANDATIPVDVSIQAVCAYGWDDDTALATAASLGANPQASFERRERQHRR